MSRLRKQLNLRQAHKGSTLIVTLTVLTLLIGFLGIGAFIGIQSFVQGELQKAANAAVLVGASHMFESTGGNLPTRNDGQAVQSTMDTINAIISNSPSLAGYSIRVIAGPTVDAADRSVRLDLAGEIPTPFLALAGIKNIEVNVQSKAQAVQMRPTDLPGQNVYVEPTGYPTVAPGSVYQQTSSNFPILDRAGNDIYIKQGFATKGYQIEACTQTDCYNLGPGAKGVGGASPWPDPAKKNIIRGDVLIDMAAAGVKKANSFKISDDGKYYTIIDGARYVDSQNDALTLESISVFGYAALCPTTQQCTSPPLGYAKY